MAHVKTERQIDRENRFGTPMQWVTSIVVGGVSGASTFINLVRTKFHTDTLSKPEVKALYEAHGEDLMGLTTNQIEAGKKHFGVTTAKDIRTVFENPSERIRTLMRSTEHTSRGDTYRTAIHDTKTHFDKFLDRFSEAFLGIHSTGIKGHTIGVVQRYNTFGNYSRRNIALKTGAAIGAGIGVVMMLFNQLNTRDKLNELDKAAGDNGRKLDALLNEADGQVHDPHVRHHIAYRGSKTAKLMAEREAAEGMASELAR